MATEVEAGLRVNGRLYPIPSSFTLGEARTIKGLTGMGMADFATALNEIGKTQDPDVFAAFVWVSMHREDPTVTTDIVELLEFDAIEAEGGEEEVPPIATPASSASGSSEGSVVALREPPESVSAQTPASSGNPG